MTCWQSEQVFELGYHLAHDNLTAVQLGLVFKLPSELTHADIADDAGHVPARHHTFDVQVLNADDVEAGGEVGCQFVQRVSPDISDPRMSRAGSIAFQPRAATSFACACVSPNSSRSLASNSLMVAGSDFAALMEFLGQISLEIDNTRRRQEGVG